MKTGDKVIVPAEINGYGRGYRDREVRRGNIRNSDIH